MQDFKKLLRKRKNMMNFYSGKFFYGARTYKYKNKAYRKLFDIGERPYIGFGVYMECPHLIKDYGRFKAGNRVIFHNDVYIDYTGEVTIGDNVTLSSNVRIFSHKHDYQLLADRAEGNAFPQKTTIGKGAWIGDGAIILAGITIGEFAVIGAGSVVTHDVEPYCIYAGNPARLIRKLKEN